MQNEITGMHHAATNAAATCRGYCGQVVHPGLRRDMARTPPLHAPSALTVRQVYKCMTIIEWLMIMLRNFIVGGRRLQAVTDADLLCLKRSSSSTCSGSPACLPRRSALAPCQHLARMRWPREKRRERGPTAPVDDEERPRAGALRLEDGGARKAGARRDVATRHVGPDAELRLALVALAAAVEHDGAADEAPEQADGHARQRTAHPAGLNGVGGDEAPGGVEGGVELGADLLDEDEHGCAERMREARAGLRLESAQRRGDDCDNDIGTVVERLNATGEAVGDDECSGKHIRSTCTGGEGSRLVPSTSLAHTPWERTSALHTECKRRRCRYHECTSPDVHSLRTLGRALRAHGPNKTPP